MLRLSLLLSFLLFGSAGLLAQSLSNIPWTFGTGNVVTFDGMDPLAGDFAMEVTGNTIPASIANTVGSLAFAANRDEVYGANGEVLPNGTFENFAQENIFVPVPGGNDYYLIRSYAGAQLTYTRIDPDLNDGNGDVVDGEKDIAFYEVSGHLMVASKPDGSGHWLISADNQNGSSDCYVRTFDVTDGGLIENNIYSDSWTWVGWNSELDEAKISPDCSTIVVAFKGHYLALFQFNNETGEVTDSTEDSFDNQTAFTVYTTLEFSPNSEYLYTIGDESTIVKFDITSFDSPSIQSTLQSSGAADSPQSWKDLKLGSDGRIYILYQSGTDYRLDRIENPDENDDVDLTSSALLLNNSSGFSFPNTPNLTCAQALVISPETNDVCLGDSTFFNLTFSLPPDSVFWDFGDPESGDENFSEELNPAHLYETPGSYDVTLDAWYDGSPLNFELTANVFTYPEFDLGADQTICAGNSLLIGADDAESYAWNTGADSAVIEVTTSGIYEVIASNGPCATEDAIEVTVIPFLTVDIGDDLSVCDEPEAILEANTTVNWSDGSTGESLTVTEPGTYFATLENECFQAGDTVDVQFIVLPTSDLPGRIEACEGDSLFLMLDIENAAVEWSGNGLFSDTDSLFVSQDGVYSANYIYEGCPGADEVEVDFLPYTDPYQLVMPNVFTPNGDNVNNFFGPVFPFDAGFSACTAPALEVDMRIYNRWGNNIVEGECIWDGRSSNNDEVSEGVYYYIVDLRSVCLDRDETRTLTGHLTLIRDGQ